MLCETDRTNWNGSLWFLSEKRDEGFREVSSRGSGRGPRAAAAAGAGADVRGPRRREQPRELPARLARDSK